MKMSPFVLAVMVASLAACGSDTATTTTTTRATTTTAATTTTTTQASGTTAAAGAQQASVTPSTGLADKQVVHVTATGFSPGQTLAVIECADKGDQTDQGDCNLAGLQGAKPDPNGMVTADLQVLKGPFGGNNIVCSASQKCLISVTQLVPTPTEVATAEISFG